MMKPKNKDFFNKEILVYLDNKSDAIRISTDYKIDRLLKIAKIVALFTVTLLMLTMIYYTFG